ncbi:lactonase family protein [Xanthovirga aplysinae]|uniref:lactonase family protein n=1 Tax=Xanthovirga aplysinae TaxID=2529853 RepID=UPI0012BBB4F2|nr:lactonase family protein [Xanthovirga aplysinae]MTI33474.1 lactonase family protein [Xanthovirga aplysinae]
MRNIFLFLMVLAGLWVSACQNKKKDDISQKSNQVSSNIPVYVGTYTKKEGHVDGKAEGVYLLNMDKENGHLELKSTVAKIANPSYLTLSSDGNYLYAISELTPGDDSNGYIYAYEVNGNNGLNMLQKLPTNGLAPCFVTLDREGNYVFVANYLGGVVDMYKRSKDGQLTHIYSQQFEGSGPHGDQDASHPHEVVLSPDNRFVFVPDKGSDKIWILVLDKESGKLILNKQPYIALKEGAGPRHFVFHPNGQFAYVINELDNQVQAFSYNKKEGELTDLQSVSALPSDFEGTSVGAEIDIHPNGKFLFASNRGHDSLAVFQIDENSGRLTLVEHVPTRGEFPRNFSIDPSGKFLYISNQNTDNIVQFLIDQESGKLSFLNNYSVKTPVCLGWGK